MIHVVLSGGLDSTTLLAYALSTEPDEVVALTIDYGQRHHREIDAAAAVAARLMIPHRVVDARGLLSGSALLGADEVPHGHYAADTMTRTVVQGRNLLFAAIAVGATKPFDDQVWLGVHAGDHPIYPDCRPVFWQALSALVLEAYAVHVATPFVEFTKADIAALAHKLGAPVELSWSCYEGGDVHCGRCGTCVERAEAFSLAKVEDPTVYADPVYWREVTA